MSLKYHLSQLACIWSPAQSYFWKFGGIWFVILACLLSFAILATHHQGPLYPWACGGSRAGIRRGSPQYCTERRSKSPCPEQCRDASSDRLSWKHRAWQGRADGAEGTVLAARAPGWADGLGLWGRIGSGGMNWVWGDELGLGRWTGSAEERCSGRTSAVPARVACELWEPLCDSFPCACGTVCQNGIAPTAAFAKALEWNSELMTGATEQNWRST